VPFHVILPNSDPFTTREGSPVPRKFWTFPVRNVQQFHLSALHANTSIPDLVEQHVLQEISTPIFANLTPILMRRYLSSFRTGRLEKLQLSCLSYTPSLRRDLLSTLENQKQSITELMLHFHLRSNAAVNLQFPERMPKLWALTVLFKVSPILSGHTVSLTFGKEDGRMDYNRRFPALAKLTVWPVLTSNIVAKPDAGGTSWVTFLPTLTPFLATVVNAQGHPIPVPTIRCLRIPLLLRGNY